MDSVLAQPVNKVSEWTSLNDVFDSLPDSMTFEVTENQKNYNSNVYVRHDKNAFETGIKKVTNLEIPIRVQYSFTDKNGKNRTTKYMPNSNYIDIQAQQKIEEINPNSKIDFGDRERLKLINGEFTTTDKYTMFFLSADNCPEREDFTGKSRGQHQIKMKLKVVGKDKMDAFELMELTRSAANAMHELDYDSIKALYIEFEGFSVNVPEEEKILRATLFEAINGNEERLNRVIAYKPANTGLRPEIDLVLNDAIAKGIISFNVSDGTVSMMKKGSFKVIKTISAETDEQLRELFAVSLTNADGEAIFKDIKNAVKK